MQHMKYLPPELLLEIYQYLPLKGLIHAQGVCTYWRRLVPHANILSERRALLTLYMNAMRSDLFLEACIQMAPYLESFDREAYLKELCTAISCKAAMQQLEDSVNAATESKGGDGAQTMTLPTDFRIWILEWPARAILWLWPGLNFGAVSFYNGSSVGYNGLTSCFSRIPRIDVIECYENTAWKSENPASVTETHKVLAIEVWWHSKLQSSWLVVDWHQAKSQLRGTVRSIMPVWYSMCRDLEAHSWIEYLEQQINDIGGLGDIRN